LGVVRKSGKGGNFKASALLGLHSGRPGIHGNVWREETGRAMTPESKLNSNSRTLPQFKKGKNSKKIHNPHRWNHEGKSP